MNLEQVPILMADDDEDDRILTQDALEESRLRNPIYFVKNGQELLDYLYHRGEYTDPERWPRPGLILLDLNMPILDGKTALKIIKSDPTLKHIPVVILIEASMIKNILLIEDDDDDYLLFSDALSEYTRQFKLIWSQSFNEGLKHLVAGEVHCCITDYYLGEKTGFDVIREAIKLGFSGPLIMLTGAEYSEKIDEKALSIGADDYLNKSEINPTLLKRTLLFNIQRKENEIRYRTSEAKYRQMAEISSSTLHNIGNVLNNLTIGSQAMEELITTIKPSKLNHVADLLEKNNLLNDEPKAKLIPQYLRQVSQSITDGTSKISSAVKESLGRLTIAEQAIAVQQNTMRTRNRDNYLACDVVNEALTLHRNKILRDEIECAVSGDDHSFTCFERTALLHILINLVKNAIEALYHAPKKQIHVHVARPKDLVIRVTDSGYGIDPDVIDKLFTHGFSTKNEGNGFGLHFCHQVLTREGGTISAHSEGPGTGATFELVIPAQFIIEPGQHKPKTPASDSKS